MHDSITSTPLPQASAVWVLDDDKLALEYFAQVLTNHQLNCRIFQSPKDLPMGTETQPACMLIDLVLGEHDGLKVATECRTHWPHTSLLLISGNASVPVAVEAMRNELDGVLEKPIGESKLIAEVTAGIERFHQRQQTHNEQLEARHKLRQLSDVELEILKLIVAGKPNKAIATHLSLALRTIEKHRSSLFNKLDVSSAAEATRIWVLASLDK